MEVGGIEPPTRYVAQGLTPYCDKIVTVFLRRFGWSLYALEEISMSSQEHPGFVGTAEVNELGCGRKPMTQLNISRKEVVQMIDHCSESTIT